MGIPQATDWEPFDSGEWEEIPITNKWSAKARMAAILARRLKRKPKVEDVRKRRQGSAEEETMRATSSGPSAQGPVPINGPPITDSQKIGLGSAKSKWETYISKNSVSDGDIDSMVSSGNFAGIKKELDKIFKPATGVGSKAGFTFFPPAGALADSIASELGIGWKQYAKNMSAMMTAAKGDASKYKYVEGREIELAMRKIAMKNKYYRKLLKAYKKAGGA